MSDNTFWALFWLLVISGCTADHLIDKWHDVRIEQIQLQRNQPEIGKSDGK